MLANWGEGILVFPKNSSQDSAQPWQFSKGKRRAVISVNHWGKRLRSASLFVHAGWLNPQAISSVSVLPLWSAWRIAKGLMGIENSHCLTSLFFNPTFFNLGKNQKLGKYYVPLAEHKSGVRLNVTSDQIRSVAQSSPTLCDPMNRSTPGLSVHHQLPEFTETHVHRVSDAIQPSDPLWSPSSAPNPSQHQGLFQWVNSSYEVAKVLEFQLYHHSFQRNPRADFLQNGLVGSPRSPRDSQESSPTPQFKSINSSALSLLHSPTLTSIHDHRKNHSLD